MYSLWLSLEVFVDSRRVLRRLQVSGLKTISSDPAVLISVSTRNSRTLNHQLVSGIHSKIIFGIVKQL